MYRYSDGRRKGGPDASESAPANQGAETFAEDDEAGDPGKPLAELPLVTGAQRRRLLEDWNATQAGYPADETVAGLFQTQAAQRPDATAITDETASLTYGQLNEQSNRLARYLQRCGVAPGVLVGICLERSPQMLVGLLGILKAGGAYLPLDPAFPCERLAFMLRDSGAGFLLTQQSLQALLSGDDLEVILVDSDWPRVAREEPANLNHTAGAVDLAYVLYTSGSTGQPKGVEIPHRALTNFLCAMRTAPGFGPQDSLLALTTLSFDIAALELYLPLIVGGRIELSREAASDVKQLAGRIERCRPTMMQATPSTWQMLLESGWEGTPGHGGALRRRGASAASRGQAPRCARPPCGTCTGLPRRRYGPPCSASKPPTMKSPLVGRSPTPPSTSLISNFSRCRSAYPGELFIGGDGLAAGYRNRPDLTAERFIANPFSSDPGARIYRTGDLARYREDGRVVHLGRLDFQVKVRGYRIELGEIEAALSAHATLAQAVVMAREDQADVTSLVAYVVPARGRALDGSALREFLRERLPDYMIPQYFVSLPVLPLTPNGKIDRKQLPAPERGRPTLATAYEPASTGPQLALAAIWEAVLGIQPIGIDDNFFDLGGSSLLAVRMLEQVQARFGRPVSVGQAFARPTIRGLEAVLAGSVATVAKQRPAAARSASTDIAIVGMAGRFPGCRDIQAYWQAICEGRELITFFEEDDIHPSIDRRTVLQPNYVKARGVVDQADCFDAAFFGITPKEADVVDPQQRILLEVAWHALEDAGIHGDALEQQSIARVRGGR